MPIFCNFWQIYNFISIFFPSPTDSDSDSDSIQYNISKFAIEFLRENSQVFKIELIFGARIRWAKSLLSARINEIRVWKYFECIS